MTLSEYANMTAASRRSLQDSNATKRDVTLAKSKRASSASPSIQTLLAPHHQARHQRPTSTLARPGNVQIVVKLATSRPTKSIYAPAGVAFPLQLHPRSCHPFRLQARSVLAQCQVSHLDHRSIRTSAFDLASWEPASYPF